MAKMTVTAPTGLLDKLSGLGNKIDDIAPAMLKAGITPLEAQIKENASQHVQTGSMKSSVKAKKAKRGKDGTWKQRVEFEGYDKSRKATKSDPRGVPNARKAMSLEYGTSKQTATPFIRPAVVSSEKDSVDAMQNVFNQEVSKA